MNPNITSKVDWKAYAQKYDMLLSYNPFYQELHQQVISKIKDWKIAEGDTIADIGAGTGNYSVAVAKMLPHARIMHLDNDEGMNAIATKKAEALNNFHILDKPVGESFFAKGSLQGLICINAIYTFPNPQAELKKMHDWLAPGGRIVLVDPGRIMNLLSWKVAISWHLLRTYGLTKTIEVFQEAKAVSKQNAYIRKMQQNGTFWTHTHEEFCDAIRAAGFQIETSDTCYRGECDLVIAHKA